MNEFQSNIDLVKQLYDAFSKKDINQILAMLSHDVEWGEPDNPYNPAAGTRKGHSGFLQWLNIGKDAEEILILQPKKFLTNEDTVAVTGYMKCLAKPTGKIYESDFVHLIEIKDNKIIKFQEFFDTYIAGEAFRNA
jgi:ketosteroid isomerase-like protein